MSGLEGKSEVKMRVKKGPVVLSHDGFMVSWFYGEMTVRIFNIGVSKLLV